MQKEKKHKKHRKGDKVTAIMCVSYLIMAICTLLYVYGKMPRYFTIPLLIVSGVVFIASVVTVNDAVLEDYYDDMIERRERSANDAEE